MPRKTPSVLPTRTEARCLLLTAGREDAQLRWSSRPNQAAVGLQAGGMHHVTSLRERSTRACSIAAVDRILQARIAWSRYDIEAKSLLLAKWPGPRFRKSTVASAERTLVAYSIRSSARMRSGNGTSILSAFAVLRLIMSSSLAGCSTGRSPGLAVACCATFWCKIAGRQDHVDVQADKLGGQFGKLLGTSLRIAQLDRDVSALNIALLAQSASKGFQSRARSRKQRTSPGLGCYGVQVLPFNRCRAPVLVLESILLILVVKIDSCTAVKPRLRYRVRSPRRWALDLGRKRAGARALAKTHSSSTLSGMISATYRRGRRFRGGLCGGHQMLASRRASLRSVCF
jgi:hypothetical protein